MKLNLNGTWDFHPNGVPESRPIVVPTWWDSLEETTGYPHEWSQGLNHGVYHRTFNLAETDLRDDVFIHIGALATLGKISINGESVGPESTKGYLMTLLPYDLDITETVHQGENQVQIEVWSVKQLPQDALAPEDGPDRLLFPFGTENIVGRVGLGGDVWIENRAKLRIDDLQIMPDLKENSDPSDDELKLKATIVNETDRERALRFGAEVRPWNQPGQKGSTCLSFESVACTIQAHTTTTVALSLAWPDAHYWSRSDPFLYMLLADISENGTVVGTAQDRFGFRQFWRNGDQYFMNGIPIRLRGDSLCFLNQGNRDLINEIGDAYGVILDDNHGSDAMVATWIDAYKHANANIIRNHIRSVISTSLFDHADETGMLIEEETAFWNPGSVSNVSLNPPYYLNYSDEAIGYYCEWVERWVRAYRNHPSIVLWSTTNEAWNPNDATELIAPLLEAVMAQDPTRLVINDGFNKPVTDEDSRHYYGGYPSGMTSTADIYSLYQIDSPLPLGAGEEFSVSTAGIPKYDQQGCIKDIYHGRLNGDPDTISRADFAREVGRVTRGVRTTRMADWKPFCLSMFIYDNIEKCLELDQAHTPFGLNPKRLIRPQFDPRAEGNERWHEGEAFDYFTASYADVAAYDKAFDKEPRLGQAHKIYLPGQTSERTIIVHNDEERRGTSLNLVWQVAWEDCESGCRTVTQHGARQIEVPYAQFREVPINITIPNPEEAKGAKLMLILSVQKEDNPVFREENFLGWIDHPAPARLGTSHPQINLGQLDWISRKVKHCIHLRQEGGAMSEHWTAQVLDDANGALSLECEQGNLRHEQDVYYTINPSALRQGESYCPRIRFQGENRDEAVIAISFTVGSLPGRHKHTNLASGTRVTVSSQADLPGWTAASLVDNEFEADYDRFGWSSAVKNQDHKEWVQLELQQPTTLAQVALIPRGQNPGGTVAETFHGQGEGVGGVLEFAAGHKAKDPNQGQGFPLDFSIKLSHDGKIWSTVSKHRNYPLPHNALPQAFDFTPMKAVRFIRIEASRLRPNPHQNNCYAMQLTQVAAFADHFLPTIPAAPERIRATAGNHRIHLTWQYKISQNNEPQDSIITLTGNRHDSMRFRLGNTTETADLFHVPFGNWQITIAGINQVGRGESSQPVEVHVGPDHAAQVDQTMPVPTNLKVQVDTDSMAVTVTPPTTPPGTEGCNILLKPVNRNQTINTAWVPSSEAEYRFENLPVGTYTVLAEFTEPDGRISQASTPGNQFTIAKTPTKPNKPGVTSSGSAMDVTWKAPENGGSPITSYILTLHNLTRNRTTISKIDGDKESTQIVDMEPGNYTVSLIAVNAMGISTESSPSLPCIIK